MVTRAPDGPLNIFLVSKVFEDGHAGTAIATAIITQVNDHCFGCIQVWQALFEIIYHTVIAKRIELQVSNALW